MTLTLPSDALLVLVGPAGCGKSIFALTHFEYTQVVSADECRALVSDDPNSQAASKDAFDLMHAIVHMRLKRGRLTVADATHVRFEKREPLLAIAALYHRPAIALVFQLPEELCQERNRLRPERQVPVPAIKGQLRDLRESLPHLAEEGFSEIHLITRAEESESMRVTVG